MIVPFPTDPPGSSRGKVATQKRLDFAQTNLTHLTQEFPHVFHRLFHYISITLTTTSLRLEVLEEVSFQTS